MDKTLGIALLAALPLMGMAKAGADRDEQERALILEHIHGIFRAYLAGDRVAMRRMHTTDWTGFQGPSTRIERGLEDYMRNAELSLRSFRGTGYELIESEVQLYGAVAIVYYVARYDYVDGQGVPGSLALRSIDVYRKEDGHWNQCGSHITPIPRGVWGEGAG